MFKRSFPLLVLLFFYSGVYSQTALLINNGDLYTFSKHHYHIFIDSTQHIAPDEVIREHQSLFQENREGLSNLSVSEYTYWIRFQIINQAGEGKKWVLEIPSIHTEHLSVFFPDTAGNYKEHQSGNRLNFGDRHYKVTNFIFDLPGKELNGKYIFMKMKSSNNDEIAVNIKSQEYFTAYSTNEYYLLGAYYGILMIMLVYNLLLFINSGEKIYLFYGLYVICSIILSMAEDGLGFQYLWPNSPFINQWIHSLYPGMLFLISFILYSGHFLDLMHQDKKYLKIIGVSIVLYIASLFFNYSSLNIPDLFILPFLAIYYISVQLLLKGYQAARFFVVGYSFVLASLIINQLRYFGYLPHNIFTVYSFYYSLVIEVMVLSIALSDKIKILKKQKENTRELLIQQLEQNKILQEKVNKELEDKVAQRTMDLKIQAEQLQEANKKLEAMSEQVNQMNSKLDYDNWQLNKKIKEETHARFFHAKISYEEFLKIFPNEISCLQFIEQIKWEKGYQCSKCSHPKFSPKQKLLSRKCTSCGHIESVTASTLLHGVKFPINKALYIIHEVLDGSNQYTIDQLSELIDLNRTTCWKFRKKVEDRYEQIKNKTFTDRESLWKEMLISN